MPMVGELSGAEDMKRLALILCLLLVSCQSATQEITRTTSEVRNLSASSQARAEAIVSALTSETGSNFVGPPFSSVIDNANGIIAEQKEIQSKADYVQSQIPRVKDIIPWWATLLGRMTIVLGIIASGFLVWYLGLGAIIRKALWAVGLLIPEPTKHRAAFDAEAIVTNQATPAQREAIAASRAGDKAYNHAFIRAKNKQITGGKP
jgi:hypothetical protein